MTSALARKYKLDVAAYNSGLSNPAAWTTVFGITDWVDSVSPTLQDVSDFDTSGWSSSEKTMQAWTATAKMRRPIIAGNYDAGQEILRAARLGFGDQARVFARFYDRNSGPEAYQGVALVTWTRSKTGVADIEEITVTLTGTDVPLASISNPAGTSATPVITGITPSGQGSGKAVEIIGSGFTGATAVSVGIAVTNFTVVNDELIEAVLATASAGNVNATVTTGVGASANYVYTRAA